MALFWTNGKKPVAGMALKALCLLINTDPLIKGLFYTKLSRKRKSIPGGENGTVLSYWTKPTQR